MDSDLLSKMLKATNLLKPERRIPHPADFARRGRQFLSFSLLSSSPISVEQWPYQHDGSWLLTITILLLVQHLAPRIRGMKARQACSLKTVKGDWRRDRDNESAGR